MEPISEHVLCKLSTLITLYSWLKVPICNLYTIQIQHSFIMYLSSQKFGWRKIWAALSPKFFAHKLIVNQIFHLLKFLLTKILAFHFSPWDPWKDDIFFISMWNTVWIILHCEVHPTCSCYTSFLSFSKPFFMSSGLPFKYVTSSLIQRACTSRITVRRVSTWTLSEAWANSPI